MKELEILYKKISKKHKTSYLYINNKILNYLNLSVHLSRDDREFDIVNYKLLLDLFFFKKTNEIVHKKIKIKDIYLRTFKEFEYLPSIKIILILCKDILMFIKQLIDIISLIIIILFSIIFNKLRKTKAKNIKNKRIYSIYYWKKKGSNSNTYYYPNIDNNNSNLSYISSFADTKFLSIGLLNAIRYRKYLSPANLISFKGFFLSIIQFIHLYLNDLILGIFHKDFYLIKFWFGWKKASEIFYAILNYNSIVSLVKISKNCEFISWYENQVTNKSFSIGVSSIVKKYNPSCKLSTFFGTPFSTLTKSQFLPQKEELTIGLWGKKFYLQDKDSFNEMSFYLSKFKNNISLEIVPKYMQRTNSRKNLRKTLIKKERAITIFTHDSYWDLVACIISIFNLKNKGCEIPNKLIKKNKLIYIRLHPSLNKDKALENIKNIKEIPNFLQFYFIDNEKEAMIESFKLSSYCFFGLSSHINMAINLNCNVVGVQTNHILKNPIKRDLLNSTNLKIFTPWY